MNSPQPPEQRSVSLFKVFASVLSSIHWGPSGV